VDDKDYKISEAWKNEALAHMELNGRNHPHIIKGIAAFTQNKDYHLVLEWSDGDLRSFWAASPNPDLSGERIMEILKELRGLASALEEMHKVRPRPSRANSTASGRSNKSEQNRVLHNTETKDFMPIPTAGRAPGESQPSKGESRIDSVAAPPLPTIVVDEYDEPTVDLDQMENWRHGDIKPENILRFDIPSTAVEPGVVPFTWLGRLKLADLGRAKQRFQETQKMTTREYDEWRTKPYDSPDDWVGGQKTSMSRLYDIWSLGCVCFEMVIWLLYGFESHQNFSQKAIEELPTWRRVGTPYWAKKGNSAQVDKLVTLWINRILEVDPVAKRGVTALGDLLVLVQEKLLVVELPPAPKCRANAADMVKELDKIINNADTRPEYLYSNPDRTGIQAPPSRTSRQIDPAVQSGGNGSLSAHGAASVALTTRSMSRYTHNLSQQWRIFPDDEFAAKVLKLHEKELGELFQVKSASCTLCKSLDLDLEELEFTRSWQELQPKKKGNRCELCAVLLRGAKRSAPGEQFTPSRTFSFKRVPSGLQINGSAYPLLRICQKLGMSCFPFNLASSRIIR
jgi:serine/threonine protein kinase